MVEVALLIDTTYCIGCQGCQIACKQWWNLTTMETEFNPGLTNPPEVDTDTFTHIDFHEVEKDGKLTWNFVHRRCFHCINPACVSVCPVQALKKFPDGPVVWDEERCIGCRYCQNACPFDIPKFEWEKTWPKIQKCWFCWDRLEDGLQPACAKTCPPSAIEFGLRDSLVAEAHRRIEENPGKYVDHVYGETEVGGTSLLYLSAVPFEELGFKTDLKEEDYPDYTWEFLTRVPYEVVGLAAILAGVYFWRKRRMDSIEKKS